MKRRFAALAVAVPGGLAAIAFTATATAQTGPPQPDPAGIINLPAGFS